MNDTYKIQLELLELSNSKLKIKRDEREKATPEQLEKLKNMVGFYTRTDIVNDILLKYPTLKIIHTSAIEEICEKYNLVFGEIDSFNGDIPKKNADELLKNYNYILKKNYNYINIFKYNRWFYCGIINNSKFIKKYGKDKLNELIDKGELYFGGFRKIKFYFKPNDWLVKVKIIAPLSDFNVKNKKLKGYKLINEDPIVLMKVANKMWAVLTAWGPESQDVNIFNENLN